MTGEACPGKEKETSGEAMPDEDDDGAPKKSLVSCDGAMPCVDDGCIVGPEALKGTYDWSAWDQGVPRGGMPGWDAADANEMCDGGEEP